MIVVNVHHHGMVKYNCLTQTKIVFFSLKGFCLHPLVTPSTHVTNWFKLPMDKIRNKFNELDDARQTVVIVVIIIFLIGITICLITLGLRQIFGSRLTSKVEHENVEYVVLQNIDDNDDEETRSMPRNGHTKQISSTETFISMDRVERT